MNRARWRFGFLYRFGHPRWDTGITPPELVELVEGAARLPAGRALDLGCGTGTNVVYLSEHGWEATGVDFIARAIRRARARARRNGSSARFVAGDVTRLQELDITGPCDLVVDIGCFHGIPVARRDAYVQGVVGVTRPGSTLLMFEFGEPAGSGPGAPETEIRDRFGGHFELTRVQRGEESPGEVRRPAWYTLVRR